MLGVLLLILVSIIDFYKQEFSELQALFFFIGFFIIGLIQGFNIINFVIVFVFITFLIKKNILYSGDYLITGFAFTFTNSFVWLILALLMAFCLTIFYKEITKKTSTGFIPYFCLSLIILIPFTLI